ncbi:DUF6042 family protein [Streptomyces sp. NPDC088246]|uniref:DUF6042 family protein n=1 Tax=Streptomyces sp. NPDC088246 TaxID=3365842 RepID=UPI00380806DF
MLMKTEPLKDWSEQNREQHFHEVMRGGWARLRPHALTFLLTGLVSEETPLARKDMTRFVCSASNPDGDLNLSCWENPSTWDEDERAEVRRQMADAARYAAHYGLPPLQTNDDVITLLVAADVIHEIPGRDGVLRLHPAHPLPAPADVFPLTEEEAAIQRRLRFEAAYEDDSYKIINLFHPDGDRQSELTTSLERLARAIGGDPHDARQAVQLLLNEGDFTTSLDITDLPPHKVFRLWCDWTQFDATRIGIHGMTDEGQMEVTLPTDFPGPEGEPAPRE